MQCIEPPFSDRSKLSHARKELSIITQKKRSKLSQGQKTVVVSNLVYFYIINIFSRETSENKGLFS